MSARIKESTGEDVPTYWYTGKTVRSEHVAAYAERRRPGHSVTGALRGRDWLNEDTMVPYFVAFVVVLLAVSGCGKRDNGTEQTSGPAPVSAEELAAVKKAMTRGMQAIGFANLKPVHVGKGCVMETRTPDGGLQIKPPPPPPGMVHDRPVRSRSIGASLTASPRRA